MTLSSRRTFLRSLSTTGLALAAAACSPASTPTSAPATKAPESPTAANPPAPTATVPAAPANTPLPQPTPTPTAVPVPVLAENDRALKAVTSVKQIARLLGEGAINDTIGKWGLAGADLGSMFDKGDKLYMVFGDSFGCCIPGTGGPGDAVDWRYNTMAVITDRDPSDGLTFDSMITDKPGHAKQLIPRASLDKTCIPTYGVAIDQRMFLHYMDVEVWGDPGKWYLSGSGLAYSDDDGQTWTKKSGVKWDGKSNFGQAAFVKVEDELYIFGIPGGRFGGAKLAKVKQADILNQSAYTYFTGLDGETPQWKPDETQAALIVPAPVGELSVMWNNFLGRWIMTYLDSDNTALVVREAVNLWGPWSPEQPLASDQGFPGLYGAFMHPWYVENDGESIYFTMSQWGPYAVFLMKAKFAKA